MYLGTLGPPSSAFPKNDKLRRAIKVQIVITAKMLNMETLKLRDGSFTIKPPGVSLT